MKLAKSLLLGSAAAIVATAGAQAADLPFRKAAPVEYVRVCDWTGAGYFYIPGTDTCLKIGGFVRAEYEYVSGANAFVASPQFGAGPLMIKSVNRDRSGFFVRGRLEVDARTQTAYGTLRTFVRYQSDRYSGAENSNGFTNPAGSNSSTYLDKGFIQFAGITAGRVQSFFDFGADPYGFEGVSTTDDSTQVFAYTYTAAGGFSATIAAEDPNVRRNPIGNTGGALATTAVSYAGDRAPDVVGVLRVDQAWGAAQLSAAYHEVNTTNASNVGALPYSNKDDTGFAVRGAVQIKLPMLAAGDEFQIEGGYENGAYQYQNSNGVNGGYGNPIVVGGFQHPNDDAIAVATPGGGYTLNKAEGYSVSGGFQHYFTPQFNNIVFGSYDHVTYGHAGSIAWTSGGVGPTNSYRIADQFNWFPVKNLQIGLEVMYIKIDQKLAGLAATPLPVGVKLNPDAFVARFRMERDF